MMLGVNNSWTVDWTSGRTFLFSVQSACLWFVNSSAVTDASVKGIQTQENFVGCIRNLQLNDKPQPLFSGQVVGDVQIDSCPVN